MFMPHDRTSHTTRSSQFAPMADATGTPSPNRSGGQQRPVAADHRDFREQADGAP